MATFSMKISTNTESFLSHADMKRGGRSIWRVAEFCSVELGIWNCCIDSVHIINIIGTYIYSDIITGGTE